MSPPIFSFLTMFTLKSQGPSRVLGEGVERAFIKEVKEALAITIRHDAWPDTYGRAQPNITLSRGGFAETTFFGERGTSPFRMLQEPVEVVIGDELLETSNIAQKFLTAGFSRHQVLVHILAHEAYHSNEGQHIQRCRVPFDMYDQPFISAMRPDLPESVVSCLQKMAKIAAPLKTMFSLKPNDVQASNNFEGIQRLHTKINEGAADVHSIMVFQRAFPEQALRFLQVLTQARRDERLAADAEPIVSLKVKVGTYDNATCLKMLLDTPMENWPKNQHYCTIFALQHALPFLNVNLDFQGIMPDVEHALQALNEISTPLMLTRLSLDTPESLTSLPKAVKSSRRDPR